MQADPMVTTVAPTIPVEAASSAPTRHTEYPNPPRTGPNSAPIVLSKSSAIFERSSVTPMNMNSGTAISTSLRMIENIRCGNALRKDASKTPAPVAMNANSSEPPAKLNATGKPNSISAITHTNSKAHRTAGIRINSMPTRPCSGLQLNPEPTESRWQPLRLRAMQKTPRSLTSADKDRAGREFRANLPALTMS